MKEEQGGGQPLICNPSSAASDREREGEGEEQNRVGDRGREERKKCRAGRKWEIVSPRTSIMFFLSLAPDRDRSPQRMINWTGNSEGKEGGDANKKEPD